MNISESSREKTTQFLRNPLEICQFYVSGGRNQAACLDISTSAKLIYSLYILSNHWKHIVKRKYEIAVPDEELIMIR